MGACQEQGFGVACVGYLVTVAARDTFDEAVVAKSAQVVGGLPAGQRARGLAEERLEQAAQVVVGEPAWRSRKMQRADSSAWARGPVNRSPGTR